LWFGLIILGWFQSCVLRNLLIALGNLIDYVLLQAIQWACLGVDVDFLILALLDCSRALVDVLDLLEIVIGHVVLFISVTVSFILLKSVGLIILLLFLVKCSLAIALLLLPAIVPVNCGGLTGSFICDLLIA